MSGAYCEDCEARSELSFEDLMEGSASCDACGGVLVLLADESEEEAESEGAEELPPLPSWDGSDTREVMESVGGDELQAAALALLGGPASEEPPGSGRLTPIEVASAPLAEEEVVTVELAPGESSAGRASRAYDPGEVRRAGEDEDEDDDDDEEAPGEATRDWLAGVEAPPPLPSGEATRTWGAAEAAGRAPAAEQAEQVEATREWDAGSEGESTRVWEVVPAASDPSPTGLFRFDRDPDWEALMDEGFGELEEEDPTARRKVIRVPSSAALPEGSSLADMDALLRPFGVRTGVGEPGKPVTQRWKVEPRTQTFHVFAEAQSPRPQRHVEAVNFRDLDPALCVARFPNSPRAGRFATLANRLAPPSTVLVTSTNRGEGRTCVALNLALAAARAPGGEALLIEADLDGGSASSKLGIPTADLGVLTILRDQSDPRAGLIRFDLGEFSLLPRGRAGDRGLVAERLGDMLLELRKHYPKALIVVDGPPVREGASRLIERVDGALLVVRRGRASRDEVGDAIATLGRGLLLGAVFNEG